MGHRLTKIYTKTGDDGSTGLGDGTRVPKDDIRVEAYGTVDELNSLIGLILSENPSLELIKLLETIQHHLFDLGGELCIPGYTMITEQHVSFLEAELDKLNATLPPLKDFILPNGNKITVCSHIARTVCRRAERRIFTLHQHTPCNPQTLKYINRLSDFLFVLARYTNQSHPGKDTQWRKNNAE